MKLILTIILIIISYLTISNKLVIGELQATGKPLIEIIEGLVYQHEGRNYYIANIINNSNSLDFHNVTINCVDCFGNSDQFKVTYTYSNLVKNPDGTYTLASLPHSTHETFAYNGPDSARWYVVSSN